MTEAELVEGCRQGHRDAQHALFERTSERIYRTMLRMTGNAEDAFDLTQEAFVKAFSQIAQFNGRAAVTTWLYRIAVNEALQLMRRRGSLRIKLEEAGQARPAVRETPDTDARLDVEAALQALPPMDRSVLVLRYQEGLDYQQIAETLGCSEGTVASRLNRARHRVRSLLGAGYGSGEEDEAAEHPTIWEGAGARPTAGQDGRT